MSKTSGQLPSLGVLGGGQLGRMLLHPCQRLGVQVGYLDPEGAASPAGCIAQNITQGSYADEATVLAFGQAYDVITVEIEHVNIAALRQLQAQGKRVYPQPDVLATVQDKGLQKEFYRQHSIPTAAYTLIESARALQLQASYPGVLKLRRGGYDGRGVVVLRNAADLAQALANGFDAPCVYESAVNIRQEIAIIVARNTQGQLIAYPPVEMAFHPTANLVEMLFAPANLSTDELRRCTAVAVQVAEALGVVGLLAVELFIDQDGQVLVNEVAPRTHNSGHHTIEANMTSQFEQHLRAVLGLPLGSTALKIPAVMVNLLGAPGHSGPAQYQGLETVLQYPGVNVHLYGKAETRPMRKMGHVTITDPDLQRAIEKARLVQQTLRVVST